MLLSYTVPSCQFTLQNLLLLHIAFLPSNHNSIYDLLSFFSRSWACFLMSHTSTICMWEWKEAELWLYLSNSSLSNVSFPLCHFKLNPYIVATRHWAGFRGNYGQFCGAWKQRPFKFLSIDFQGSNVKVATGGKCSTVRLSNPMVPTVCDFYKCVLSLHPQVLAVSTNGSTHLDYWY